MSNHISLRVRVGAGILALLMLVQPWAPTATFALTGGPSQPEVQGFAPIGTNDMVDPFTGDFSYSIPLMDVGGYPLNLAYSSGITMDQQASWVGLGWSLNPGAINRTVRGLPDDFNGEKITTEYNFKPSITYGLQAKVAFEMVGFQKKVNKHQSVFKKFEKLKNLGVNFGVSYNNKQGVGSTWGISPEFEHAKLSSTAKFNVGGGSHAGTNIGVELSKSFPGKLNQEQNSDIKLSSAAVGGNFSTRAGLQNLTLSTKSNAKFAKNMKAVRDIGLANAYNFASPTYTPGGGLTFHNHAFTADVSFGFTAFGGDAQGEFVGYMSAQSLANKQETNPAYGYAYSSNGQKNPSALHDFNREKEGPFNQNTPNIGLTNYTYDVYAVSGQGIGGSYRPHRGDVGYVYDPATSSLSTDTKFPTFEASGGNLFKGGMNYKFVMVDDNNGAWTQHNEMDNIIGFKKQTSQDPLFEPVYYTAAGQMTYEADLNRHYAVVRQTGPFHYDLNKKLSKSVLEHKIGGASGWTPNGGKRSGRNPRNESIQFLTAEEATVHGVTSKIRYYVDGVEEGIADGLGGFYQEMNRVSEDRLAHHHSEVQVVRPDGAKYVYGIPAYNLTQREVTFAAHISATTDHERGEVTFDLERDASVDNENGKDHYFEAKTIPAHAHSFLLTSILGTDYRDIDNVEGPSPGDLGTYTKLNYSLAFGDEQDHAYEWRTPYKHAGFQEGLMSKESGRTGDNKGSYTYGTKELWYLHSVETKTHVAYFKTSPRDDGYEAGGENALAPGTKQTKKLDKIELYTRQDVLKGLEDPSYNPVPIKTVHFKYDYSLCPGAESNKNAENHVLGNGKLTLLSVYFTYRDKDSGARNGYNFHYGDVNHNLVADAEEEIYNPAYHPKAYDRWGNYQPVNTETPGKNIKVDENGAALTHQHEWDLTTASWPYVNQKTDEQDGEFFADKYAGAWSLTTVELPSKGLVKVDYESDDYAYVQNKRSMRMFKVEGAGSSENYGVGDILMSKNYNVVKQATPYRYLYFDPAFPADATDEAQKLAWLKKRIVRELLDEASTNEDQKESEQFVYYKFLVDIGSEGNNYEYVSGYGQIESYGICANNGSKAYIQLRSVATSDRKSDGSERVHPVTRAAWDFGKSNMPDDLFDQPQIDEQGAEQIFKALTSMASDVQELALGVNTILNSKDKGKDFIPEKSFIRLYEPTGYKKGGGCRVKRVSISDQWQELTDGNSGHFTNEYGQEYDYSMWRTTDRKERISSGVAAYEPMIGGDENPFRQPVFYEQEKAILKNDLMFREEPFGESFFPGASVGYRQVTVKSLHHSGAKKHSTGRVLHEFYTAFDYPTKVSMTAPEHDGKGLLEGGGGEKVIQGVRNFLGVANKDFLTVSQGFAIETNDMHGKQKAQYVFPQDVTIDDYDLKAYVEQDETSSISSVHYKYLEETDGSLRNWVQALQKNPGTGDYIRSRELGVDIDVIHDFRESHSSTYALGINGNLDGFIAAIVPAAIPTLFAIPNVDETLFRSAGMTKVVNRFGLLDEVVAKDVGSVVRTKNLLYDGQTGEVIMTETQNEYDDPLYNFTYPSYLGYDRMGPAYQNVGALVAYWKLPDPDSENYQGELDDVDELRDILGSGEFKMDNPSRFFVKGDEVSFHVTYFSSGGPMAIPNDDEYFKVWVQEVVDGPGTGDDKVILVNKYGTAPGFGFVGGLVSGTMKVMKSGRTNQQTIPIGSVAMKQNPIQEDGTLLFNNVIDASAVEFSDQWTPDCNCVPVDHLNDYLQGKFGIYRPQRSWLHLTDRVQTLEANAQGGLNINKREDGVYESFNPFWTQNELKDWPLDSTNWTYTTEVTKFNQQGFELENRDALNRKSAALYGYESTLPIAVGSNAEYREVGFDGFEDYDEEDCKDDHFSWREHIDNVTDDQAHSGKHSIKVEPGQRIEFNRFLDCPDN